MIKGTKKVDPTKSPSIRGKVPCYDGKWAIELYDTKENMIYPCDNDRVTPPDFVPKLSQVACVLQCGGIWLGQKGWGVTWKVIQCVVKPREVVSVYGQCRVMLSDEERGAIETQQINDDDSTEIESDTVFTKTESTVHDVAAEDSDEDADMPEIVAATPEVINVAPVTEEAPVVKKKKMVKKKKVVEAAA
jgi:hypothetical protein